MLLKFCQNTLDDAEQRVRQLEGDTLQPFAGATGIQGDA
jgi:exonuclease VII small subunit